MPTTLPRRAVNGMLVVPADSPYIDHPPRDLRWVGLLLCTIFAVAEVVVLVRFAGVL